MAWEEMVSSFTQSLSRQRCERTRKMRTVISCQAIHNNNKPWVDTQSWARSAGGSRALSRENGEESVNEYFIVILIYFGEKPFFSKNKYVFPTKICRHEPKQVASTLRSDENT